MNDWWIYVTTVAGDDTQTEIAKRAGVSQGTVSRWSSRGPGNNLPAVAAFARAYGRHPFEAFVAAGFFSRDELDWTPNPADPSAVPTDVLFEELRRRSGA